VKDESNGKTRTKTEKTSTLQMKSQQHQPKQTNVAMGLALLMFGDRNYFIIMW